MPVNSPGKTWKKSLGRVARMSRDEIRTRVSQEFAKRWDATLHGIGIRIGSSIPTPVKDSTSNFFFGAPGLPEIVTILGERLPQEANLIVDEAERICQHRFDLLGYTNLDYGQEIDWHLDAVHGKRAPRKRWYKIRYLDFNEVGDHKIIWELNRHQHLMTLAKAYCFTREKRFGEELVRQWYHWQAANRYPIGINWASSLEVAFRSLSWIWVQHLLADSPAMTANFRLDLLCALRLSGRHIWRHLSTYFSPNTHLLGEVVALFFIGTVNQQLPEAELWRQRGWEIILREADRQVLPDGLYFEQSIYYHVYALDIFLHARSLAACNKIPIPGTFDQKIEKMLEVLRALGQAGVPPSIGDDDGGRVFNPRRNQRIHMLDPLSTGAAIFGSASFKSVAGVLREETVWLLGRQGLENFDAIQPSEAPLTSVQFEAGGLYVMAGSDELRQRLVIAAGPSEGPGSGHAHADALSVQLTVGGQEWLVDPGSFCYICEKGKREFFRGTAAHNTLRVDGEDQAEMGGPFSWRSRVNVQVSHWMAGKTFDCFVGSHNGYSRLPQPVVHERWVLGIKGRFWFVRDLAQGHGLHQLELSWHLAPGFQARCTGETSAVRWTRDDEGLVILPCEGHGWSQQITQGEVSPVYGKKNASPVLNFRTEARLPVEFGVLVLPDETAKSLLGVLDRIDDKALGAGVCAYRYACAEESHFIFFSKPGQRWNLGIWSSDAQFLYCAIGRDGQHHWVLGGGSFLDVGGRRIIECKQPVARFEWWNTGTIEETSCSDTSAVAQAPQEAMAFVADLLAAEGMGQSPSRVN